MPRYMTTAEVAALCRTSPETIRFWRYVGKGPASFKVGRKVLYDGDAVEAWLKEAQQAGTAAGPIAS
jgi:DNA-binding transcriptional MerR regulator